MSKFLKILIGLLVFSGIIFIVLPFIKLKPAQVKAPVVETTFEEIIASLNSSDKLIDYLNKGFVIEDDGDEKINTPQEFFQKKSGGEKDFSIFSAYVLASHGYEVAMMTYKINSGDTRTVTIFRDIDLPKYIFLANDSVNMAAHGWSFEDLFRTEEKRLNIQIVEYKLFSSESENLIVDKWTKRK